MPSQVFLEKTPADGLYSTFLPLTVSTRSPDFHKIFILIPWVHLRSVSTQLPSNQKVLALFPEEKKEEENDISNGKRIQLKGIHMIKGLK